METLIWWRRSRNRCKEFCSREDLTSCWEPGSSVADSCDGLRIDCTAISGATSSLQGSHSHATPKSTRRERRTRNAAVASRGGDEVPAATRRRPNRLSHSGLEAIRPRSSIGALCRLLEQALAVDAAALHYAVQLKRSVGMEKNANTKGGNTYEFYKTRYPLRVF